MVIIFHMSLSLLRYQPNFEWGINARQRTKYVESFFTNICSEWRHIVLPDRNSKQGTDISTSRTRLAPWLLPRAGSMAGSMAVVQGSSRHKSVFMIVLHGCLHTWFIVSHLHIILTWRYTIVTYEVVSILPTPQQNNSPSCCTTSNDNLWSSDTLK